jgi:hypothetical protein
LLQERRDVDDLQLQLLVPREGQELAGQTLAALARRQGRFRQAV